MGRFKGQYPNNWKEIAKQVKDEAYWTCIRCAHPHDPKNGYCLTVHHLDGNKENCQWFNLAVLCQRCHLRVQAKVVLERPWYLPHSLWFRPLVAGYYASIHNLPTDKEYVYNHMSEIIEMAQDYGRKG